MAWEFTIPLRGGGGEPVDFARTIDSHGLADLPPFRQDEGALEMTLALPGGARTIRVGPAAGSQALVSGAGRAPGSRARADLTEAVTHVLRLDEDLSPFYAMVAEDPDLAWAARGAGRMVRSPTVFEDVIKTICTTNCAWSATVRMVRAIVEHLGARAPGAPETGWEGRAFPTPAAMAEAGEGFYTQVARAGYRARSLHGVAASVASGAIDLEGLAHASDASDEEVEAALLALPGVGPYAAAHIMTILGRYRRLIFDSWTRPTYARLVGRRSVADRTIERRFRRYGRYAGLAFWLFLTRDWVQD